MESHVTHIVREDAPPNFVTPILKSMVKANEHSTILVLYHNLARDSNLLTAFKDMGISNLQSWHQFVKTYSNETSELHFEVIFVIQCGAPKSRPRTYDILEQMTKAREDQDLPTKTHLFSFLQEPIQSVIDTFDAVKEIYVHSESLSLVSKSKAIKRLITPSRLAANWVAMDIAEETLNATLNETFSYIQWEHYKCIFNYQHSVAYGVKITALQALLDRHSSSPHEQTCYDTLLNMEIHGMRHSVLKQYCVALRDLLTLSRSHGMRHSLGRIQLGRIPVVLRSLMLNGCSEIVILALQCYREIFQSDELFKECLFDVFETWTPEKFECLRWKNILNERLITYYFNRDQDVNMYLPTVLRNLISKYCDHIHLAMHSVGSLIKMLLFLCDPNGDACVVYKAIELLTVIHKKMVHLQYHYDHLFAKLDIVIGRGIDGDVNVFQMQACAKLFYAILVSHPSNMAKDDIIAPNRKNILLCLKHCCLSFQIKFLNLVRFVAQDENSIVKPFIDLVLFDFVSLV
eukprot:105206_1